MRYDNDYRRKKRLDFTPQRIELEDWELWQFHHALIMALRIITCGR